MEVKPAKGVTTTPNGKSHFLEVALSKGKVWTVLLIILGEGLMKLEEERVYLASDGGGGSAIMDVTLLMLWDPGVDLDG